MHSSFEEFKKHVLQRPDKSAKKSIDEKIKPLCNCINALPGFVTLSSCSGRITLTTQTNKKLSTWIYTTHDLAKPSDVLSALKEYSLQGKDLPRVEFKQESAILHLALPTPEQAICFINSAARQCGFGRFGITSIQPDHTVVELICLQHLSVPVFDQTILVEEEYLSYLVELANVKLQKSWQAIEKLTAYFAAKSI
jgi:tRNA(Phe) wybutosine-synthesizing methylase Tyw3